MSQALDPVTQNHVDKAAAALAEEFAGIFSRGDDRRDTSESPPNFSAAHPSTCSYLCSLTGLPVSG